MSEYLDSFFSLEKKSLLHNYPGLNLHRLRQDIVLHAFLNGLSSEGLFDHPYLPSHNNPLTLFFKKLKAGIPLEYITGYAYFYRSLFKVTTDVLIPRSETEILVEIVSSEIKKRFNNQKCRIIDIGTGSGVIGLSILMESISPLDMTMSDISAKALQVARENYFNLRYTISSEHQVNFLESDRLKDIKGEFDIIVSNPPYIKRTADLAGVHHQVLGHEPHLALFLEDAEYEAWFDEFFTCIYEKLSSKGLSLIEGHEEHLEQLKLKAEELGFRNVEIIKDYTNRNRFLKLHKSQ